MIDIEPDHELPNSRTAALRERLLQRMRVSVEYESRFHTVRRDGPWQAPQGGARCKLLTRNAVSHSALVELEAGTTLRPEPGMAVQELVLLGGLLQVGAHALECGDALCTPHDAPHAPRAGATPARFYLRLSPAAAAPAQAQRFSTLRDDANWQDFCPGVRIRELRQAGAERRSVIVRMAAGARVNSHSHALDEECMMLAGEAFLGDTLLRSGEFQLAPQGSRHGAIQTDVGALFFVHGSLDPAAYA